jgi:hypothetical protein
MLLRGSGCSCRLGDQRIKIAFGNCASDGLNLGCRCSASSGGFFQFFWSEPHSARDGFESINCGLPDRDRQGEAYGTKSLGADHRCGAEQAFASRQGATKCREVSVSQRNHGITGPSATLACDTFAACQGPGRFVLARMAAGAFPFLGRARQASESA